jgi:peptidoglycan/xylan/chitin deacetylase (PgdA/CDA1 family)
VLAGIAEVLARTRTRRARAAVLLALAAATIALAVALASSGHGAARTARAGAATATSRSVRHPGAPAPARAPSLETSGQSREIRRLIALGKPVYCGGHRGNEVALTFDDGPGVYTRIALRKLRAAGVGATFFLVGRNLGLVAGAPRAERALGMVGDHTFDHPLLPALAPAQAESEIVRARAAIARASGGPVFLFRPPYGAMNARLESIVRRHSLLEILWDVDSQDSLRGNYEQIASNVIAGLRPGTIALMHENHGQTIRALPYILDALRRRHLRAVSVPRLLTDDPPSVAQLDGGWSGCGLTTVPRGD